MNDNVMTVGKVELLLTCGHCGDQRAIPWEEIPSHNGAPTGEIVCPDCQASEARPPHAVLRSKLHPRGLTSD